jgi:hypothetical protein
LRGHEVADEGGDFVGLSVEREVASIKDVDFRAGHVFAIALGLAGIEGEIVFAPDDEEPGLCFLHPCLPLWIGVDVGAVVVEEIALNLRLGGRAEEGEFVGPEIRIVEFGFGIVADVAGFGGLKREQISAKLFFVGGAVGPECSTRYPVDAEAFIVGDGILDYESLDALGVRQSHAKADGAAVVLHVEGVTREADGLREAFHDGGDVVECVGELRGVGPIVVTESRVIGSGEMIAIGEAVEERLKHARGRGKAVKEEEGGSIFESGFTVEDGRPSTVTVR